MHMIYVMIYILMNSVYCTENAYDICKEKLIIYFNHFSGVENFFPVCCHPID
ncbi:hypothetical protein M758_1G021100 [Ceratodon purpureus]|uniref:Uncharacterized protein n=1 Tax=Ceratodon purpureus TaxID=3225 RepID=A0A8T0J0H5_CERPU|nr:hypothetical protein KC19_1G022300 [Ceratodon purpureus]KAG0628361.1 hypothetical protein M758_1G021100 [Ceratodon purpureus]